MFSLRKTFHCFYTTSPDDEDQYRVKNIRLASCHLVVVLILADVSRGSSYLVIGKKECEPGRQRGISISDKTPLQAQLRYGIFQPPDFPYTSTSYCCLIVPPPIDY